MNRLDLIIDALEGVSISACQPHKNVIEALAAAHELRELKPVAWVLIMNEVKVLDSYYDDIQNLNEGTKLYALDEVTK